MLKTKKRNIFENLTKTLKKKAHQEGSGWFSKKKSKNNGKKRSLFSKLFDTDCEKINETEDTNLRQRKCLKKSKTCKYEDGVCKFKTEDEKKLSKKKKKLDDKERSDELDNKSLFKNSYLYNANIMCYYRFCSRKRFPRVINKKKKGEENKGWLSLNLTHEKSKITFSIPANNDGWIRNFWHIFVSHASWLRIYNRFEQRYTGKLESEFGENSDKEGNLYEVYLEFGKNMNVAYRQFMEFIVEMHAGRENIDPDQLIDKLFDNIINKSIGLEYYINRAKIKYVQDFKLEKSGVFKTGNQAFSLYSQKEAEQNKEDRFKYNPQGETKMPDQPPVVDRTQSQEDIEKQKNFIMAEQQKKEAEQKKIDNEILVFQNRIDKVVSKNIENINKVKLSEEIQTIVRAIESFQKNNNSKRNEIKNFITQTQLQLYLVDEIIAKTLKDLLESNLQKFIEKETLFSKSLEELWKFTNDEYNKDENLSDDTIKYEIKKNFDNLQKHYRSLVDIYYDALTTRQQFLDKVPKQAGGSSPMNIGYTTTGSQGQSVGEYSSNIANKLFQGRYGNDESFSASRTPAISMLKSERPDEDFFDEAAKELDIDKSFVKNHLTPDQIIEYRILKSNGNLKYVTPIDYLRWATEDTLRLQEDYRYAKYNIRVINKIMKSFEGFCLSNLIFKQGEDKNPTAKDIADGYAGIVIKMRRDTYTKAFKHYSFTIDKLGAEIKDEIEVIDNHNRKMGDLADINDSSIENDIFRENLYRFKDALEEKAELTNVGVSTEKTKVCKNLNEISSDDSSSEAPSVNLESDADSGVEMNSVVGGSSKQYGGRLRFAEGASYRFRVTKQGHFLTRDMFILPPIMFTKNKLRCGEKIFGEKSSAIFKTDCEKNPIQLFTKQDIAGKNYVCTDYRNPSIKIDHARRYLKLAVANVARKRSRKNCFRKDMIRSLENGVNKYRYWGFVSGLDFYLRYDYPDQKKKVAIFIDDNIKNKIIENRDGVNAVSRTPVLIKADEIKKNCNPDEGYFQLKNLNPLQDEILNGEKGVNAYLLESITKGDRQFMRLDYNDILVKATEEDLKSLTLQNTIRSYINRQLQILEIKYNNRRGFEEQKDIAVINVYKSIQKAFELSGNKEKFIKGIGKNIFFIQRKLKYVRLFLHKVRSTPFEDNSSDNWQRIDNKDQVSTNNRLMLFMDDYFESSIFAEIVDNSIKDNFINRFTKKIQELEKEIAEGDLRSKKRTEKRRDRSEESEEIRKKQMDARASTEMLKEERKLDVLRDLYKSGTGVYSMGGIPNMSSMGM